jgi:uncharacterized glyoxalase superfamily protein PhnB
MRHLGRTPPVKGERRAKKVSEKYLKWSLPVRFVEAQSTRNEKRMAAKTGGIPKQFHSLTAHLVVRGAAQAIEFYKKRLGAIEHLRMSAPDGAKLMHAEIQIGDSIVLLCDEFPEMGGKSPQAMEGSPVTLTLYVEDADATFNRASAGQGKGHDAAARHALGRPLRQGGRSFWPRLGYC